MWALTTCLAALLCALFPVSEGQEANPIQIVYANERALLVRFALDATGSGELVKHLVGDLTASTFGDARMFATYSNADFGRDYEQNFAAFGTNAQSIVMPHGIMISTGDALHALGETRNVYDSLKNGLDFAPPGPAGDSAGFELDFTVSLDTTMSFKYIFASRELPEYGGSAYNDDFQMKVYRANGVIDNIAKYTDQDGGLETVTINNITPQRLQSCGCWSNVFIPNFIGGEADKTYTGRQHFGYTGYTKRLIATDSIKAFEAVKLNITITDQTDGIYDSAVFLEANSFQFTLPVATFSYSVGQWGGCSVSCGTGLQSRSVFCKNDLTNQQVTTGCTTAAPSATQACALPSCVAYSYSAGQWGGCSVTCGSGLQTRAVNCIVNGQTASVVSSASCVGQAAPSTTQACSLPTCISYAFAAGQWGGCSVTCGSGVQTRSVFCQGAPGNIQVADTNCATQSSGREVVVVTRPSSTQACTLPTCISYAFVAAQWGGCSVTCGSGTQTRAVFCQGTPGNIQVADSFCSVSTGREVVLQAKPTATQSCALPTCISYAFVAAQWGSCSVTCGSGFQTRDVYCNGTPGNARVADSFCSVSTGREVVLQAKPTATQSCVLPTCITYAYATGAWGACSVTCGGGLVTRSVFCQGTPGNIQVADSFCSGSGREVVVKPSSTQSCLRPTCISYGYQAGLWGTCSVTCGSGLRSRNVECIASPPGVSVPTSLCSSAGIAPTASEPCTLPTCIRYQWEAGQWGCNSQASRQIVCRAYSGTTPQTVASDVQCASSGVKPSATASTCCGTPSSCAAPAPVTSYYYAYGPWGACSVTCGSGTRSRSSSCLSSTGQNAPSSACAGVTSQDLSQSCAVAACTSDPCNGVFGATQTTSNALESSFVSAAAESSFASRSQVTYGPAESFGTFCGGGFGIVTGIVISTGKVSDLGKGDLSAGANDGPTAKGAADFGAKGTSGDDIGFELRFTPRFSGQMQFKYVFASRELPEYMGQKYNDAFYMRLNGQNIAKLTNQQDVTINNLGSSKTQPATWSTDYIDNPQRKFFAGITGYTRVLTAQGSVAANQQSVLNITVTDIGDGIFDTAVFIEENSFALSSTTVRRASQRDKGEERAAAGQADSEAVSPPAGLSSAPPSGIPLAIIVGVASGIATVVLAAVVLMSMLVHSARRRSLDCTDHVSSLRVPGTDWYFVHGNRSQSSMRA